jgi:stearoyl-CoA desaturase (delta-9 desaturase)
MYGAKRYDTGDTSRNNWILAFLLLGEGWHNNHHHYAVSARNGFFWWEIDVTYYLLYLLSLFGIVKDLRQVPENVLNANRIDHDL